MLSVPTTVSPHRKFCSKLFVVPEADGGLKTSALPGDKINRKMEIGPYGRYGIILREKDVVAASLKFSNGKSCPNISISLNFLILKI